MRPCYRRLNEAIFPPFCLVVLPLWVALCLCLYYKILQMQHVLWSYLMSFYSMVCVVVSVRITLSDKAWMFMGVVTCLCVLLSFWVLSLSLTLFSVFWVFIKPSRSVTCCFWFFHAFITMPLRHSFQQPPLGDTVITFVIGHYRILISFVIAFCYGPPPQPPRSGEAYIWGTVLSRALALHIYNNRVGAPQLLLWV